MGGRKLLRALVGAVIALGPLVAGAAPVGATDPLGVVSVVARDECPEGITRGPDGNVWFTDPCNGSIGRITPAAVVSHFTGLGIDRPAGITAGPDGNLWFTNSRGNSIGRITPNGVVSNFAGGGINAPQGIAAGPDGNVWFTNAAGSSIGRITPAGVVSTFSHPSISAPQAIVAGPDGNLWFTNFGNTSVGRITPMGVVSTFSDPTISSPEAIAAGPDGNLWFTNLGNSSIGRVTPDGAVTSFVGAGISTPRGIATGPDGNVWFTSTGSIGRITPAGVVSSFAVGGAPLRIASGADGNLWFTNLSSSAVGTITTSGTVGSFAGSAVRQPYGITTGPDGNVWFTNEGNATIGRVTPDGAATVFTDVSIDHPRGIAAGPDANLWFTNSGSNSIGRITPAGVVSSFIDPSISDPQGIAVGSDGNLWFTNLGNDSIGRITPEGAVSQVTDASIHNPYGIIAGADGNLWFTNGLAGSVGRVTTAGAVSSIAVPTLSPFAIAAATDGTVWFTDFSGHSIGRIAASGAVSIYSSTDISSPSGITPGPDGNMWFTNNGSDTIARIGTLDGLPSAPLGVSAVGGNGQAVVSWSPPASDGGSPVTGYTVTASPGGMTCAWVSGPLSCTVTGLSNGTPYTFTVTATNATGTGGPSWPTMAVTPGVGAGFHAVTPFRVLDSRGSTGGWNGVPLGAGDVRDVTVTGVGLVPVSASAVVMNVTVTGGTAASYVQAFPSGSVQPTTANVLFAPGDTVRIMVTVGVGAGGKVSLFNQQGSVHVVVDVVGYFDDGTNPWAPMFHGVNPIRALDSRSSIGGWGSTPLGPGQTRDVVIAGVNGVPSIATAVVMNVTVTEGTQASYLQAFPSGATRPTTANLLFGPGQTVPNLVTVGVGSGGRVSLFNQLGNVHVIADVVGYFDSSPGGSRFHAITPARLLDSRHPGLAPWSGAPLGANSQRSLAVAGTAAVPAGATGLVANVTVTGGTAASYLSVSPTPGTVPAPTANLLFAAGQTVPNAVMVGLGASGAIDLYNQLGATHVIIDAAGYYAST